VKRWRSIVLLVFLLIGGITVLLWRGEAREMRYYPEIQAAAKRYDVDPSLVKAVVWRESRFQAHVRGKAGEIGLMQIQEIAAQEWADAERDRAFEHEHCLDPGTNTMAGTFYLGKLLKRYQHTDNPIPYALADYNAGRRNLLKWNKDSASTNSADFIEAIGFPSTKDYVKEVTRRYAFYKWLSRFGL
jgi:soluble lytic murein transglycosylase